MQAHTFDDIHEMANSTIQDYLMKLSHDIITFKMCDKILEFWCSQKVEWHIERGLKLNSDGTAALSGRAITPQMLESMPAY